MRGFKDYRKLTMVGVRFGLGHCSFGGQVALFCDQERSGRRFGVFWATAEIGR